MNFVLNVLFSNLNEARMAWEATPQEQKVKTFYNENKMNFTKENAEIFNLYTRHSFATVEYQAYLEFVNQAKQMVLSEEEKIIEKTKRKIVKRTSSKQ